MARTGMEAAKKLLMRKIKLTGREATLIRAIGFTEAKLGSEIHGLHANGCGRRYRHA